jgi:ATP-dependent RNA helicase DeaD
VRTKIGADRLARALGDRGVRVKALHGDMSQGSRDGVMIAFKGGRERLLVATDIAARGLDISGVSHVVNYDIPNSPDVYVHRIGRTGRVGRSGRAITLINPKQRRDLEAIERHANTEIVPWSANGGPPARKVVTTEAGEQPAVDASPEPQPRPEPDRAPRERRETRRPRHTKPRRDPITPRTKLLVGAGRAQGVEPADIVRAIVDNSHLEGEDVTGVRVLERFSFAEVPADRAGDVVRDVAGKRVRGIELRVEVASR